MQVVYPPAYCGGPHLALVTAEGRCAFVRFNLIYNKIWEFLGRGLDQERDTERHSIHPYRR